MRLNEYIVEVVMQQQYGMIVISVKEENADLALNKVQGMLKFKDENHLTAVCEMAARNYRGKWRGETE